MIGEQVASLARRGWHVFPVERDGKRPCIDKWEERASADPRHVAAAWEGRWAGCNVGVACGPSGLVVIDLDVPKEARNRPPDQRALLHGANADGAHWLAHCCNQADHPWPGTFTVNTPSGGMHLYFAAIPGRAIRNSAGKIAPRIDVRAAGGYVIAPGSIINGRQYTHPSATIYDPWPLPAWLADLADPPPPHLAFPSQSATPGQAPGAPPLPAPGQVPMPRFRPAYATAALVGEIDRVMQAPPGTRNNQLNRSAFALGQLAGAGFLDPEEITRALLTAAGRAGLVTEDGQRAVLATIRSGLGDGMARPRYRETA